MKYAVQVTDLCVRYGRFNTTARVSGPSVACALSTGLDVPCLGSFKQPHFYKPISDTRQKYWFNFFLIFENYFGLKALD